VIAAACGSSGGDNNASSATTGSGKQPTGAPIVIGMDEDTSGPGVAYTSIAGATVRDAIDQINSNGGILNRPVKLISDNDASDPTKAPAVVRGLIDKGAVGIIMNSGSQSAVQVKPVLKEAKVPGIAPTNLSTTIGTPPDNEFSYMLANPISDIGKVYVGAFAKAGVKKLAVFTDDSAAIGGQVKLLLPQLKDAGIQIVGQEQAASDSTDVTAQVTRMKSANPDAFLALTLGGQLEILFENTAHDLAPKVQRFSIASIGNQPQTWTLAKPNALDGLLFIASISSTNPKTQELEKFLKQKRGSKFTDLVAYDAQAYDAVQLFKMAIEKAGSTDPVAINNALQQITGYESTFGQKGFTLSFSPTKHVGTDGLCGLVVGEFSGNKPGKPWDKYQPTCG
jgi:branched-chain amino acid transport system substrate-binding protein